MELRSWNPFACSNDQTIDRTLIFLKFSFFMTMVALKERYDLIFQKTSTLTIAPGIFPSGPENLVFEGETLV